MPAGGPEAPLPASPDLLIAVDATARAAGARTNTPISLPEPRRGGDSAMTTIHATRYYAVHVYDYEEDDGWTDQFLASVNQDLLTLGVTNLGTGTAKIVQIDDEQDETR
jgi:hypothetical protein